MPGVQVQDRRAADRQGLGSDQRAAKSRAFGQYFDERVAFRMRTELRDAGRRQRAVRELDGYEQRERPERARFGSGEPGHAARNRKARAVPADLRPEGLRLRLGSRKTHGYSCRRASCAAQ